MARGGIILTREVTYALLNRLSDFTEWNQCAVMNVLLRYSTKDEDEIFDILVSCLFLCMKGQEERRRKRIVL